MVRSLTGTLTTQVNASTRLPAITLTAEDHNQHFATLVTPANADAYSDACVAGNGNVVRVQITGSGFACSFQWQVVSNPATSSQWSTWTTFSGGSANIFDQAYCAVSNTSGTLFAFAQRGTGGNNLWVWTSANNGASWTGPVSIGSPPGGALIKGIASAGHNDVMILYDILGGESLATSKFSGGVWSALLDWGVIVGGSGVVAAAGYGLATAYNPADGFIYVVLSDLYQLISTSWAYTINSWNALLPVIAPTATTGIVRVSPAFNYDSNLALWNLSCIEYDPGTVSGTVYNYPRVRQTADLLHYSAGTIHHDLSPSKSAQTVYISALSGKTGNLLVTENQVQYAADYAQSNAANYVDLSGAVLSYARVDKVDKPNTLSITLDNAAGALSSLVGTKTSYQPINSNCTLVLSEGYKTGSPPTNVEVVTTGKFRINKIQFLRTAQENLIKIVAQDNSRLLDIVNRFQISFQNDSVSDLVKEICARAGLFLPVVPSTTQTGQVIALFIIQSGQTYRQVLNSLCDTYHLEYYMNASEVMVFVDKGGEPSNWTYQNEITSVVFGYDDMHGNHVIVTGKPPAGPSVYGQMTAGESYDDVDSHLVGMERVVHHIDQKLLTLGQCSLKAGFILDQEKRAAKEWHVSVPLNPALQCMDIVTINDSSVPTGSGQSGNGRIIQNTVVYHAQQATFEMTMDLEDVV